MKFKPMTKEELELANLLEPGVYSFEVMTASDEVSKAGNEMIKLKINVFGDDREAHVYDYLMEKMAFKLRHFAETTGLINKYDSGTLSEVDCEGKTGFVKIVVESANGGYPPKNSVKDYVMMDGTPSTLQRAEADLPRKLTPDEFSKKHGIDHKPMDGDIPF